MDVSARAQRSFARRKGTAHLNPAMSKSYRAINGLLINPFAGKSHAEMLKLIKRFREETDLDVDETLLAKAAFLSQDAQAFSSSRDRRDGLTLKPREQEALHTEATRRFNQPVKLYVLIGICSLCAAVQGWDEAAANQAQQYYYPILQPSLRNLIYSPTFSIALINSAPWLSALVGVALTDPVNRYFGRRGALFIACFISCIACVFQALARPHKDELMNQLILSRLLLGIGIGLKSTSAPIYAAECTPKAIRGAFVMMWQMWTAFGLLLGYVSGYIFRADSLKDFRWRLTLGSPAVLPLLVCTYIFFLPESPRLLILWGRKGDSTHYQEAFDALTNLRTTKLQALRDLFLIYYQVKGEEKISHRRNRFIELFSVGRNRRALSASVLCMFFQQFCGVNVLAYYSSLVFLTALGAKDTSLNESQWTKKYLSPALGLSVGFGLINFLFAIPAIFLIDKVGRRTLLLLTFPFMAIFHFLTGLAFQLPQDALKICAPLGMYLFDVVYSLGEGPVPFVYASESMPLYVRDLGMSIAAATNWLFNWLLAITLTGFWRTFGHTGTFVYYAAWCVVGFFLILLLVPETKDKSLEELDAIFSIPTTAHASHGWAEFTWFVRRYFLACCSGRRRLTGADRPQLEVKIEYPPPSGEKVKLWRARKITFDREDERIAAVGLEEGDIKAGVEEEDDDM